MDEPEMLDMGDFEVLDECEGEDEDDQVDIRSMGSEDEHEEYNHDDSKEEMDEHDIRDHVNLDDNSGDNGDNILDVSIDVAENEFLENVAKDFSENIEDDIEEQSQKSKITLRKGQPSVQIEKLKEKCVEEEPQPTPRKKPGPRCKTMNLPPTPSKKPIQKIVFNDDSEKKDEDNETSDTDKKPIDSNKNTTDISENLEEKQEQAVQKKTSTPAFLKKDLTDEEIMIHFDEIENTVLTSDSFVIQNDVDQAEKDTEKDETTQEEKKENNENTENTEKNPEENWDTECESNVKKPPKIKIEEEELEESQMWYKEKIKAKEDQVEEKFTKLAKIIQYSYPLYKKWLDKNESMFGTAICKVESSKHIPLDQLQPNRWKFICNKKNIQQASKEEENQADNETDKNVQQSWQVIPGVPDADVQNEEEYPPFVMHVVKVFEEFLQSLDENLSNELENSKKEHEETEAETETSSASNDKNQKTASDKSDPSDKEKSNEGDVSFIKNLEGLNILMRCNRRKDLMMHITGKNISTELMDKIRDLFENGPGSECNVKSLYCKTIIKDNNVIKTNTIFLYGSETLDDEVGPVKIQLAPKNNAWANLAGIELLATVVSQFLHPTNKTTVIEVGCGTGLISLLLASSCHKVIGIDVQKDIIEAEITCELNEIKNATFLTGKPKLVMSQIEKSLADSKALAVINTNNVFGRSIEVISALRKISTLGRIVIITTLTKQSIRSILELTQPANGEYGNPFIPIRACIVDTNPKGYGFEIVMSMERRTMRNLLKISTGDDANSPTVGLISKSKQMAAAALKINPYAKTQFIKNFKGKPGFVTGKKFFPNPTFNKYQGKRPFPGSDTTYYPGAKKFKPFEKPWTGPSARPNTIYDKRDEGDLRDKLSSNREPIVQDPQEQKKLMDALGKLSGVDSDTVKKLQDMLNLAIEKTNKLQSQMPRSSVWDRIAPSESGQDGDPLKSGSSMKGRLVKETGPKEIIITTPNDREPTPPPGSKSKKYHNLPPLEPERIPTKSDRLKMTHSVIQKPNNPPYQKPGPNRFQGGSYRKPETQEPDPWNRSKPSSSYPPNESQSRYGRSDIPRRSSPPRQSMRSPPRRPISPVRRAPSPPRRPLSPPRRPASPQRRPASPGYRHTCSSSSRNPPVRQSSPPRRHGSPPRRPVSPHNYRGSSPRRKSPPAKRYADEWDIPSRTAVDSGWSRQNQSSSSGWNQGDSNRYRAENSKWDNPGISSAWDNKNPVPPPQSNSRNWKSGMPSNSNSGSNWDVQKMESSRHESRHEPRWEMPEKEEWNDLPEDARDPWDDHPQNSQKDFRWNNQSNQPSQSMNWNRDKPNNDNWSNKPNYPSNNFMGMSSGGNSSGGMNPNMQNANMNMNMNNPNKNLWQSQQSQPSRNQNWGPPNNNSNWQGGNGGGNFGGGPSMGSGGGNPMGMGNTMNNWQQPPQNFSNYSGRQQFNSNPYMNNRR